jgi:pimeloyl-ACP methyl ester carboxylesterase
MAGETEICIQAGDAVVNGTRLYYEMAGSGTAVLLIHGNMADRRHWDGQFPVFARKHKVIRYDVRGFGKSDLPVEGQPYSHHRDAAALLRRLGVASAHIIGLSMGAGIAADFVLSHPDMSRSLVSVGPWVVGYQSPAVTEVFDALNRAASAFHLGGPTAALDEIFAGPLGQSIHDARLAERLRQINADYSFWHLYHTDPGETQVSAATAATETPAAQRTAEIQVPALIVTAEHDLPACREIAGLLERTIAGARKIVMPETGHIINMERPDDFNRIVLDFLQEVDRGLSIARSVG